MGGPWGRHGGSRNPQPEETSPDLERVTNETGGRMFEVSKKESIDQVYQKIQEDLRNQYVLGYAPDRQPNTSQYRKIDLATSKEDLVVQTRDGYYPIVQSDSKVTQPDTNSASTNTKKENAPN